MGLSSKARKLAVVPAYNEAACVGEVVRRLHRAAPDYDVVVVDDGSTDNTPAVAHEAGARVVSHPFNLGIGGAAQTGFTFAQQHGYDYLVQVDGDLQHDPTEVGRLEHAMTEHKVDMVSGSRFLNEDHKYPAPVSRRTGIHLFAFMLSRIVRQRVSDPTSGFRLYNRRAIGVFARDYPHDYPEVEAVLMVHANRLRMCEVPVRMYERGGGVSSINGAGKSTYYMIKVMLALLVGLARRRASVEPGDDAAVAAAHGI